MHSEREIIDWGKNNFWPETIFTPYYSNKEDRLLYEALRIKELPEYLEDVRRLLSGLPSYKEEKESLLTEFF